MPTNSVRHPALLSGVRRPRWAIRLALEFIGNPHELISYLVVVTHPCQPAAVDGHHDEFLSEWLPFQHRYSPTGEPTSIVATSPKLSTNPNLGDAQGAYFI